MSLLQGGWLVLVAICLPTQPPGLLAETHRGPQKGSEVPSFCCMRTWCAVGWGMGVLAPSP